MAKTFRELRAKEVDEISIKDLANTIAKSTGTKNIKKAMPTDKLKKDLAMMRKKLQSEKTLTPAEIKKREEIAKAMERDNPDMPMAKKMAIATATAKKVAEDTELQEGVIDQVKDIAAKKQAKKINGVMVDMFTASAISKVYDAVNDANKAKMEKLPITKLADVAMKMMQRESVELDEISKQAAGRYIKKAVQDLGVHSDDHGRLSQKLSSKGIARSKELGKLHKRTVKRRQGIDRAVNVMAKGAQRESVELEENRVDALAKDFHNRLKKAGNSDRNQNRERMATLAKAKKQGLSPIEMKQLDGKMNAVMNKMDESVNEISAKKYHAALKGREYKRDRARNSAAANQFVGKDAEAQADMAKSKDHDRKLKKMKQMGINRTARNLGEKAPKIDDAKYAAHMARNKKPKTMSSTQRSLADIQKKANRTAMKKEAAMPMRSLKLINKIKKSGAVKSGSMAKDEPKQPKKMEEKYKLHHKTMSAALQHAYDEVRKKGYEVDKDDIDRKVASGPRKPSSGKTNSYSLGLTKNGKPVKQKLQVQVYNMDNKGYELNMYVS